MGEWVGSFIVSAVTVCVYDRKQPDANDFGVKWSKGMVKGVFELVKWAVRWTGNQARTILVVNRH